MVVLSIFFRKNYMSKNKLRLLCLYVTRSCINTHIYLGMMFIICSSIRELKYIGILSRLLLYNQKRTSCQNTPLIVFSVVCSRGCFMPLPFFLLHQYIVCLTSFDCRPLRRTCIIVRAGVVSGLYVSYHFHWCCFIYPQYLIYLYCSS